MTHFRPGGGATRATESAFDPGGGWPEAVPVRAGFAASNYPTYFEPFSLRVSEANGGGGATRAISTFGAARRETRLVSAANGGDVG